MILHDPFGAQEPRNVSTDGKTVGGRRTKTFWSSQTWDGAGVNKNFVRKNAILPPRLHDKKTYPEAVSRSMPRALKDFCQCARSQKSAGPPLEKKYGPHKSAVSVASVSFSRDSTVSVPSVKFVIGQVLRFLYRPYFLFFNPPPCHKSSTPPPDNAGLYADGGLCMQMGASVGLPAAVPLLIRVLGPKTHKGG